MTEPTIFHWVSLGANVTVAGAAVTAVFIALRNLATWRETMKADIEKEALRRIIRAWTKVQNIGREACLQGDSIQRAYPNKPIKTVKIAFEDQWNEKLETANKDLENVLIEFRHACKEGMLLGVIDKTQDFQKLYVKVLDVSILLNDLLGEICDNLESSESDKSKINKEYNFTKLKNALADGGTLDEMFGQVVKSHFSNLINIAGHS